MAATKEELLAQIAQIEQSELGAEAKRIVARLHAIRAQASQLVVAANDGEVKSDEIAQTALNLAEEAAQHGVRLSEIRKEA